MLRFVIVFLICVKINAQTNEDEKMFNDDSVLTRRLIDVLRKSGSRIAAEAKELTEDLKNVVDVVEKGSYYFMISFQNKKPNTSNNTQQNEKVTERISTTTEEETNAILEQTQTRIEKQEGATENFLQTERNTVIPDFTQKSFESTIPQKITTTTEPTTTMTKQRLTLNNRPSSAFHSMLMQKIQEVGEAMKKRGAAFEFSSRRRFEGDNRHLKKRQVETTTVEQEQDQVITSSPILQQSQPDGMTECISRWDLEQHKFSEKKHLASLQKELEKMEELMEILREQQHILDNLSGIDEKYYEYLNNSLRNSNLAEQRRLVELLELLNTKLPNSTNVKFQEIDEALRLKMEVEQLKIMVEKLPTHSREIETKLSKEIEKQKMEIFDIKRTLRQLTGAGKDSSARTSESNRAIDAKYIQQQLNEIQERIDELLRNREREPILGEKEEEDPQQVYLSGLMEETEHLQQLIDKNLNLQEIPFDNKLETDALDNEEEQLRQAKKIVEDILRKRLWDEHNEFLLGQSLPHIKIPHLLHVVAAPKIPKVISEENEAVRGKNSDVMIKSRPRSSDSNDIKELLRQLDDTSSINETAIDPATFQLATRVLDLRQQLQAEATKRRKEKDKEAHIRYLEEKVKTLENANIQSKSLTDDNDDGDKKQLVRLLRRILQEMEKSGREIEESDTEKELQKLAESINRLRPQDNDLTFNTDSKSDISAAQFQVMLNRLLAQQKVPKPTVQTVPFTQQQIDFIMNRLVPQYQANFIPARKYPDFPPPPPQYPIQPTSNFFRDYPPPAYTNYPATNPQQLDSNPEQTVVDTAPYAKQKIEDLKEQIYSLQNAIANLDNPSYVKKPEDEETIYKLEQQISNLKNVVSGLTQYNNENVNPVGYTATNDIPIKSDTIYDKTRMRREVHDETEKFMERTANFLQYLSPQDELHQKNLQDKLFELEKQLGEKRKLIETKRISESDNYSVNKPLLETSNKLHEVTKSDIFEKIITKIVNIIVDKVVIAIPILIRKLFGITIDNLADYNPSYGSSVQSLKDLGIFGYLPLIILKLIDGFTYFINVMKRNKFVKTFLIPALVLAGVLGFIVFLIWWLQPDYDYSQHNYLNYDNNNAYKYNYAEPNNYDNKWTPVNSNYV